MEWGKTLRDEFQGKKAPEISRNSPPGPASFWSFSQPPPVKKNSKKTFLRPSQKRKSSFLSYFWSSRPFPLPPLRKRSRHKKAFEDKGGAFETVSSCHVQTVSYIYVVPRALLFVHQILGASAIPFQAIQARQTCFFSSGQTFFLLQPHSYKGLL